MKLAQCIEKIASPLKYRVNFIFQFEFYKNI